MEGPEKGRRWATLCPHRPRAHVQPSDRCGDLSPLRVSPGIHLIHKEPGATSFSEVQRLREEIARSGQKLRVCHGGALDPFAEGLLLLLVGPATKLMDYLHRAPKTYEATIEWGSETDNGDPTGHVVAEGDASSLAPTRIEQALASFIGWHEQVPPATSNKRIGGERAYRKAHRGEAVTLPPTRVFLHSIAVIEHGLPARSRLRLITGGGYYVRALARDLGRSLNCRAHLSRLVRNAIGPWADPTPGGHTVITGSALLPWCPLRALTDAEVGELRARRSIPAGVIVEADWTPPYAIENAPIRALHRSRLIALLREDAGRLAPTAMLGRGL